MKTAAKETIAWVKFLLRTLVFATQHRPWRRKLMLWLMVGALVQIALGLTLFDGFLMRRPGLFLCYWGYCFLSVIAMFLLAAYDILMLKHDQEEELRNLRTEVFKKETTDGEEEDSR